MVSIHKTASKNPYKSNNNEKQVKAGSKQSKLSSAPKEGRFWYKSGVSAGSGFLQRHSLCPSRSAITPCTSVQPLPFSPPRTLAHPAPLPYAKATNQRKVAH
jgi:hypothetical protein